MIGNLVALRDGSGLTKSTLHATLKVELFQIYLQKLTRAGVLEGEVLVLELVAVDGLAPGSVARGEVTTLDKCRLEKLGQI